MKLVPDGWRWPRLVTHLFDHESTTVSLGLWTFIIASVQSVRAPALYTADIWLWATGLSSILVGGVRAGKDILAFLAMKFGRQLPAESAAAPRKEVSPDAPAA